MQLILPTIRYEQSYRAYIQELGDEERYPYPMDLPYSDFAQLVAVLHDFSVGKGLPEHLVPNTTFWLVENDELVGVAHLRHFLNAQLEHAGGHIGLGIRPRFRGNGYSKLLLKLTLQEAAKKGITLAHVHCYKDNVASASMIKANNGVLVSEFSEQPDSPCIQRYTLSTGA